jgi:CelD/BcsL family acetyltransferase involved in cellulose biosynthesis
MTVAVLETARASDERVRDEAMSVHVEQSFDACKSIAAMWDQLVLAVGGDIYMTYDWCRIWWKYYGTGRELAIYSFLDVTGELVGVFPICIERIRLGPIWLRVAKLVGSDSSLTLCQPAVQRAHAEIAFANVLRDLIGNRRCDAVAFGPLSDLYASLPMLRSACCAVSDLAVVARDSVVGAHVRFTLPRTFDDYLASLGKRQRGNYRRQLRQLEAGHVVRYETISASDGLPTAFRAMRTLHETQWGAVGKQGHFGDWPDSVSFNDQMIACMARSGRARCHHITADEALICSQYCYVFGTTNYWRLPARAVGEPWDTLGLGSIGLVKQIEQSIADGQDAIEAGIGRYDYKVQWGGEELPLRSLLVVARTRSSLVRAKWFMRAAALLDLLYYRILFKRVAPMLRLPRAPLWRCWIRSRI